MLNEGQRRGNGGKGRDSEGRWGVDYIEVEELLVPGESIAILVTVRTGDSREYSEPCQPGRKLQSQKSIVYVLLARYVPPLHCLYPVTRLLSHANCPGGGGIGLDAGQIASGKNLRYRIRELSTSFFSLSRLASSPQHRTMHPALQVVQASHLRTNPSNIDDNANSPRRSHPTISSCSIRRCIPIPLLPLVPPPSHLPPSPQCILGPILGLILRPIPS